MKIFSFLLCAILIGGCCSTSSNDDRVNVHSGVKSDTLVDNYVTRPVAAAFSALVGDGIVVDKAVSKRNKSGFLEVNVLGHNNAVGTKKFRYKVEWLDASGVPIETKTSVWLPMSATARQPFAIKAVAPRVEAIDFRMDTRRWE
jgi:uncharacterized protein YcfL